MQTLFQKRSKGNLVLMASMANLWFPCKKCRRDLIGQIRIVANMILRGQMRKGVTFCPGCFATLEDYKDVEYHVINGKEFDQGGKLGLLSQKQIIDSYEAIEKEGIEQVLYQNQHEFNSEVIKSLNENVFTHSDIHLETDEPQQSKIKERYRKDREHPKTEYQNRKHLKAIGYSFQRQEFLLTAESVFGYLMSALGEEIMEDPDQQVLVKTILEHYLQEQQVEREVGEYLINSNFLLGRKGLSENQEISQDVKGLRENEVEVKKIIGEMNSLLISDPLDESQVPDKNIVRKHKEKEVKIEEEVLKEKQKKEKKERKKRKNGKEVKDIKSNVEKKKTRKQYDVKIQPIEVKNETSSEGIRRRGRPAGSKNKVKKQQRSNSSRTIVKMDMSSKRKTLARKIQQKQQQKREEKTNFIK